MFFLSVLFLQTISVALQGENVFFFVFTVNNSFEQIDALFDNTFGDTAGFGSLDPAVHVCFRIEPLDSQAIVDAVIMELE